MAIIQTGWIKAKDIKNGDVAVIVSEVKLVEMPDFNDKEKMTKAWVGTVQYRGAEYQMKFTKPTRTSLISVFGNDTEKWVGKQINLSKIPTPSGHFSIWGQPVEETPEKIQWTE